MWLGAHSGGSTSGSCGKMCEHSENGWRPEHGLPDLSMMSDITDSGINVNLRTRYKRDQIYTYSGSILLAVNPYKQLQIYDEHWLRRYRKQTLDQTDPHVFALAEAMYMNLVMQSSDTDTQCNTIEDSANKNRHQQLIKNQACVISGESGAGKTETAKFILSYLCSITPNKSTWMEHQILEANTILEAFGNAKTVRNDNSSRFGKFIQVSFDSRRQINGCIIQDYLLEQSRITYQSIDERNYHVFYQLLAAGQANPEFRKRFHLMPANFYDYLNKTQCYTIDGVNDCAMFDSLRLAMSVLNMDQTSCDGLFSVLSAILWLGNLQFQAADSDIEIDADSTNSEKCCLTKNDSEIIRIVSELLGVEREKLEPITLRRQINVRGTVTEIPFKIQEARDNRNGMAKALYSRLFTWVVNFINNSTNPSYDNSCFLGVLDIFGFENFNTNSFEQLCINYANEKLHKFFNHHMFAMEQELYSREGIEISDINYTDNTPCLELLERPPSCIFRLLSEECRVPKGSDLTFIEKLHTEFSSNMIHPFYIKGTDRRNWSTEFSIRHFAGCVTYNVEGFLKKNKDSQQNQLLNIIEESINPLLCELADCSNQGQNSLESKSSEFNSNKKRSESLKSQISLESTFHLQSINQSTKSFDNKSKLFAQHSFNMETLVTSSAPSKIRRESSFVLESLRHSTSYTNNSSKSKPTVADAFRYQLASLVELLNSVDPWYVRCIKPNLEKSATEYNDQQVLLQLKYLGMSDLIKIRREGYPIHFTKHQFVCRYRCLMLKHLRINPENSPIKLNEESLENYCKRMMSYFKLDHENWKIGKTMVFLRMHIYQPLEERRNKLFLEMATLIQSFWRSFVIRRRFLLLKNASLKIQLAFRAFRGRLFYLRQKRAVLTIQAYVRGMFAREIANAMREIKRVEAEEDEKQRRQKLSSKAHAKEDRKLDDQSNGDTLINVDPPSDEILTDEKGVTIDSCPEVVTNASSPISQSIISTSVSPSAYLEQDSNSERAHLNNLKDKKEMEELVRVLERHGISLEAPDHNKDLIYTDFEKLYDVLGNQLQVNRDSYSISPSINEDDKCSMTTVGTNCDGESVSCSMNSQCSSTVTDEHVQNDEIKTMEPSAEPEKSNDNPKGSGQETIRNIEENRQHSDSIESISSIVSSTSTQSNQQSLNPSLNTSDTVINNESENMFKKLPDNQILTSTFTGASMMVLGSKLASNGRILTRIEEEPSSTSPLKTPNKTKAEATSRQQSLFPPVDCDDINETDKSKIIPYNENKRRRLERKIIQVQQEQKLHQPINPTTAGLPSRPISDLNNLVNPDHNFAQPEIDSNGIYDAHKCNMLEYAEQNFNDHVRDSTGSAGVIRTLTRKKRNIESSCDIYLSKSEMLTYNASFSIPTSHIKMHDPHNSQISCSMFKNLCKYMTVENMKLENEIRIVQSIVRHGIEKVELRDEIYIQIIRQLTNNPNNEGCLRLWVLLGLVSAAFSPSKILARHLISYLNSKPRKDPSITCHAQFCLDNLQTHRLYPRRLPPSLPEIKACKSLTNLTVKIHLLDGRSETLTVHPCDTALDTLTKLAQKINLQFIEGWALYESYSPKNTRFPTSSMEHNYEFERSIKLYSYIADLIASWQEEASTKSNSTLSSKAAQKRINEGNYKLTLKKKIFRGPKIRNDPVEISLLYSQAVYNVVKKDGFLVDENLALSLAGLQAQIQLGNASDLSKRENYLTTKSSRSSKTHKNSLKHPDQIYDVESYICFRLRHQATTRSKKEWASLISQSHKQFQGNNEVYCKMRYLSMVIYHCPLYGTATFDVNYKGYQTFDQNLLLGVNSEGLVLIRSSDRSLINAYRYADMSADKGITVYSDENIIQFHVRDRNDGSSKCLSFESNSNEEIAMLIISYCPSMNVNIRGTSNATNLTLDASFDNNAKKKSKLKITLEDRMRTHHEVHNARKAIVKTGKLRKPNAEEPTTSLFKHTLKRLSSNKVSQDRSTRFENIYGTNTRTNAPKSELSQTNSDYQLNGLLNKTHVTDVNAHELEPEVSGATASLVPDETTKAFPHRYWAYTKTPLKHSLLIIYDTDLEESALYNFRAILAYSGLININNESTSSSCASTLDNKSIDSGIASQQSLGMNGKQSCNSPSSPPNDIYDICPKKLGEKELLKIAQGILDRCFKRDADILRNEFFLQLIKQTTDHPDPNSEINQRHWQLLALACSVTYPSDTKILSYLYAHLRRCSLDKVTNEGQYSQFTLRSLQGSLDTKGRRYTPSELEILSTINCRRVYARVYFLDGQFQAVEFDPCATIEEVVDQIKQKIGLKSESTGYALFQPLDDDCEQVLHPDEKVGDAIALWENWQRQRQANAIQQTISNQCLKLENRTQASSLKNKSHRFIFKKYLFIDSPPKIDDPVEGELLYHQIVSSIKEDKFPVLEQEATILCALKAQIEIGDYTKISNLPREHIRVIYKQIIMSLMPPHAFNNLPIPAIAQQHQAFCDLNFVDAKKYFFNLIQPIGRANLQNSLDYVLLHRAHIYEATQTFATAWPSNIWIAINQSGLHMLVAKSRKVLASCEYKFIVDYSSSNNYLMIILVPNPQSKIKYTFYTKQAQQIAQQMKDYIVLEKSRENKRRKSVEFNLH